LPLGNLFIATGRPKVTAVASARGAALGWVVHVTTDPGDYDGLPLPGGFINLDLLRQSADPAVVGPGDT
jgi:hypothetical protein